MTRPGTLEKARRRTSPTAAAVAPEPADLVDALERVRELSLRLWAVRAAHPVGRTLLGGLRCRTCARPWPCPTVRATQVYDDAGAPGSSS